MVIRDVALLILYDQNGKMLLQQRDEYAPTYPNLWCFFGGGLDSGETPDQALQREAQEELQYTPKAPRLLSVHQYQDVTHGIAGRKYYFVEACMDKRPLRLGEGQGMGWFAFSEMASLPIAPENWPILDEARQAIACEMGFPDQQPSGGD